MTHKIRFPFRSRKLLARPSATLSKNSNPRLMVKNPVMFVTMVGAAITHGGHFPLARPDAVCHRKSRSGSGSPCCSPISPKPSPKAAARRRPRRFAPRAHDTSANKLRNDGNDRSRGRRFDFAKAMSSSFARAKSFPPTAKSSKARRRWMNRPSPANPRRSSAKRAATAAPSPAARACLSDEIKIRITANPGEGFLDRMISLVEGASRQKTPNEIALTILLAALTVDFPARCRDA